MKDKNTSFTIMATSTRRYLILVLICLAEFLVLLVLAFIWWMISYPDSSLLLGLSISVVAPLVTYFLFRKKASQRLTVVLSTHDMEIQWPSKQDIISYTDIASYSAVRLYQETGDIERIRIRLKNGKQIKLSADSGLTHAESFREFREAFDHLAQTLNIPKQLSWEEKLLEKK